MAKQPKVEEGSQLGRFTLIKRIDDERGGNCNVWLAEADGAQYALKVLRNTNRKDRFRQEIAFLKSYSGPGVLPLLDSHLDDEEPLWYAMPLATPLRNAIVEQRLSAHQIIEIFAVYAETLAELAEQEVYHRDLKPDNLFVHQSHSAIGDFGLVAYPERAPLTNPDERVGPLGFFAPEMIQNTDKADYGPADVWSLMNALWATLADTEYPPPGPHREEPEYDLRPCVDHPRMSELNSLMRRATRLRPAERPTMAEIARELRAYLEPPIEARPGADVSDLQSRLAALVGSAETDEEKMRAAARAHTLHEVQVAVSSHFGEVAVAIQETLPPAFDYSEGSGGETTRAIISRFGAVHRFLFDRRGNFMSPTPDTRAHVSYSVAAVMTDEDGPVHLAAKYRVYEVFNQLEYTRHEWEVIRAVAPEPDKLQADLDALRTRALGDNAAMLQELATILARSPSTPPPPVEATNEAADGLTG